jgi:hypothetical protein
MNILEPYTKPTATDICVCFCWFNPAKRIRPLQNLLLFKSKLDLAQIPYFSIECCIGKDSPPQLPGATLTVRSNSALFYKEALWNRIEKEIPEDYQYLIFCDTDIIFSDLSWVDRIRDELDKVHVVHPFERVIRLSPCFLRMSEEKGAIAEIKKGTQWSIDGSSPGFCWAIRRSSFRAIGGFYDKNLMGCGDQSFSHALLNQIPPIAKGRHSIHLADYQLYKSGIEEQNLEFSYLPFTLYHLWHGNLHDRQYESRLSWFDDLLSWDDEFTLNSDGLWEVCKEEKNQSARNYFIRREEDGVLEENLPGSSVDRNTNPSRSSFFSKFPSLRPS